MILSNSLYNRLYANDTTISKILYLKQDSFFDTILETILSEKIVSSTINNSYNLHIIYNQILINDIIPYYKTLEKLDDHSHITILLHENLGRLKREDAIIITEKIKNARIINFNPDYQPKNSTPISYAIPKPPKIDDSKRSKKILILGQNNISHIPESDIFIDFGQLKSYNDIVNLCQQYRIVVYNHPFDRIVAQSLGCQTVHCSNIMLALANNSYDPIDKPNYDFSSFSAQITKILMNKI